MIISVRTASNVVLPLLGRADKHDTVLLLLQEMYKKSIMDTIAIKNHK